MAAGSKARVKFIAARALIRSYTVGTLYLVSIDAHVVHYFFTEHLW